MKRKRLVLITVAILALCTLLLVPMPRGTMMDGGSREYQALTYKIVAWRRLLADPESGTAARYQKTSVYWFADAHLDVDGLWAREVADPDFYTCLVPSA